MLANVCLLDEFLGEAAPSRPDFTPPIIIETGPLYPSVDHHVEPTPDVTPSVSSDSVSLPTQMEILPAQIEKQVSLSPESAVRKEEPETRAIKEEKPKTQDKKNEGHRTGRVKEEGTKTEGTKDEVLQDLRVFELNSDSGKSTPSTNGKKGEDSKVQSKVSSG